MRAAASTGRPRPDPELATRADLQERASHQAQPAGTSVTWEFMRQSLAAAQPRPLASMLPWWPLTHGMSRPAAGRHGGSPRPCWTTSGAALAWTWAFTTGCGWAGRPQNVWG